VTVTQAVLLVKAVSGYDAAARARSLESTVRESTDHDASQKPMKTSKLLSDPRPSVPESAPPISGLDAVIVFDVSDELCLHRAADTPR